MVDLIRPKVKVVTKDGECQIHITLDLNINVNGVTTNVPLLKETQEEDSVKWEVPDFAPTNKIKFGKKG